MTKVGIYYPDYVLANRSCSYEIIKSFIQLPKFTDIETGFITTAAQSSSCIINRRIKNVIKHFTSSVNRISQNDISESDVIYQYDTLTDRASLYKSIARTPVFATTEFKGAGYIRDILGKTVNQQKEADQLAKRLDKVALLHFYNQASRERFLNYRPDFAKKCVTIPFLLPELSFLSEPIKKRYTHILYIDGNGCKVGLKNFIKSLHTLGTDYLKKHDLHITFISKSKPQSVSGAQATWYNPNIQQEKVIQLMQEASICVLAPSLESYNKTLLQAVMYDCAIITNPDESRAEILGDAGIQISFNAPYQITTSLTHLIEDTKYSEKLGTQAKMRAQALFQPSVVAMQYRDCFQNMLS